MVRAHLAGTHPGLQQGVRPAPGPSGRRCSVGFSRTATWWIVATVYRAREALRELLRTAVRLGLDPRLAPLGKETGLSVGPRRYPLCRVNTAKGIAFHYLRNAAALIIRSTEDRTFRLAPGVLRPTALSVSLDRETEEANEFRTERTPPAACGRREKMSMHIVHIEYHPTGFTVLTATYREIADMADVGIRADENVDADVRRVSSHRFLWRSLPTPRAATGSVCRSSGRSRGSGSSI